ncbi:mucin-2-like, partial [Rhagoletis pomonella]|uniref:mucin-2-like n=1 Tax=Rhagoletis pomonella TaxID=28610 RepID=UPI0017800D70
MISPSTRRFDYVDKTLMSCRVASGFASVHGVCDQCQTENPVACHNETVYSLCINGTATLNYRSCPEDYVCTADVYVCYPSNSSVPSCVRTETDDVEQSQCGVCGSEGKVFACLNETTVAFCFGDDSPHYESLYNCPEGTVCDLDSGSKFCSNETEAMPSCRESTTTTTPQATTTTMETTIPDATTQEPTETTTELTTTTTATTTTTTTSPTSTPTTTTAASTTTTTTLTPTTTTPSTTSTTTTTTPTTTPTTTTATTTTPTTTTPTTTSTSTTPAPATTTPTTTTTEHTLTPAEICENNGEETSIANPDDLTCTEYIICTKSGSSWIATAATCPSNQYFDPTFAFCTTTYECPTQQTNTTTITTTISTTTTEETSTTTLSPAQVCEANG